jgi:hypothetical protein
VRLLRLGFGIFVLVAAVACQNSSTGPSDLRLGLIPAFNRNEWQHWIDTDGDCQDTRQEVLIEESLTTPVLDPRGCRVLSGMWRDEFTGLVFTNPADLDIDHRVPLANAHRSGAWTWDSSRKRAYANEMADPEHLVAVSASANRSKGDRGPEAWRPPFTDNWCKYGNSWRAIKQRWALTMTPDEEVALREMCASN